MDGETERYIHKGSPQIRSQTDKQRLPLILQMPSSNRVVRFTNILNLSALKFHVPSIQFLKGSESSAAVRTAVDSQGVRTSRCGSLGFPVLVVTPELIYYFTLGLNAPCRHGGLSRWLLGIWRARTTAAWRRSWETAMVHVCIPLPYPQKRLWDYQF